MSPQTSAMHTDIERFLKFISAMDGSKESIDSLMKEMCEYYDADRGYVFENQDNPDFCDNTFEWCREGVTPEINNLQNVPIEAVSFWYDRYKQSGAFILEVNDYLKEHDPVCYEVLYPQNIKYLMSAPLFKGGIATGFIGVDNPRRHLDQLLLLQIIASSMHSEILHMRAWEAGRVQRDLEAKALAAEQASMAKTAFLSNMSHDIRTPMNAIVGFTSLAVSNIDNKPLLEDYLRKIQLSSNHLLSLINDVLDMSSIESGKVTLAEKVVHLPELLESIRSLAQPMINARQLQFTLEADKLVNKDVYTDELRLNQTLLNLLSNAAKYTPSGGSVRFIVDQLDDTSDGCATIRFSVIDTGIGMSEEFLKRVFKPFERAANSTMSGIEGTGLGMAISKSIVDLMGGTIDVYSQENQGTTFIVTLPMRKAQHQQKAETETTQMNFEGLHALLVEDNAFNLEIAQTILERQGLTLETCTDGSLAVERMRTAKPGEFDLILMDIQMPRMNGYDATRAIRALPDPAIAQIPILAMTANAFDEDRHAALAAGMNGHVAKPIRQKELFLAIKNAL